MRDDFSLSTKELLAKRVAYRCSNPACRHVTSGPQIDSAKVVNIGVAAHITAASAGGPRFDPAMTPDERQGSFSYYFPNSSSTLTTHHDLALTAVPLMTVATDTASKTSALVAPAFIASLSLPQG